MNLTRLTEATEQALRLRGVVMLSASGDEDRWCAVCAAVDGSLEVRVGEPRGGWLRRRQRREREQWLSDHGFVHRIDAWTAPAPFGVTASWCAQTLSAALHHAFDVSPDAELVEVLVHPGLPGDAPPPDAPHAEHVRAALATLVEAGRGKACFEGGRPADTWSWAFVADGELVLSPEPAELDPAYDADWMVPLAPSGVPAAAERLTATMHGEPGRSASDPLFISFIDTARGG